MTMEALMKYILDAGKTKVLPWTRFTAIVESGFCCPRIQIGSNSQASRENAET